MFFLIYYVHNIKHRTIIYILYLENFLKLQQSKIFIDYIDKQEKPPLASILR